MKLLILNDGDHDELFVLEDGAYYGDYSELLEVIIDKTVELTAYKFVDYDDTLNDDEYLKIFDTLFNGASANEKEFDEQFNKLYDFIN